MSNFITLPADPIIAMIAEEDRVRTLAVAARAIAEDITDDESDPAFAETLRLEDIADALYDRAASTKASTIEGVIAQLRFAEQPGIVHERHVTGSDRASARHPAFRWANTLLANVKNSLLATHRAVGAKHLPRYLGAFAWRFNRRFVLKTIHERLAIAAATATPPMPTAS
jgi:hypothetical protein